MRMPSPRSAYLPALSAVALWSTVAVAFKLALRDLEPLELVAYSSLVSWLSLGGVLVIRRMGGRRVRASGREIAKAALLGLLNPLAYYWILFSAYNLLPAQVAQPLNYTWPLFLALLAAPMHGKKPSMREISGLLVSLIGVALITWRRGSGNAALSGAGIALALGSGIVWAFSWLAGTRLKMDGTLRLFVGFGTASLILVPLWMFGGGALPRDAVGWSASTWVGLFEMGITFLLWNLAMERAEKPAMIGNLVYLGPFVSLIWIALILGEHIRVVTIAGLLIIVAGIFLGRSRSSVETTYTPSASTPRGE
ncbi:MAG: DMT family transporter [Spirochaetaceae bacterium]|nr:DMT family transporter [Spirochaetaceae bacterium]